LATYGFHSILPYAAWEQITTKIQELSIEEPNLKSYNFDELKNNFITRKWISIEDIQVLNNINHESISNALKCYLCFGDFTTELATKKETWLRIIDKNSCKNLLQQIQQEDATRNWLTDLISGRKTSKKLF
jgi:hypothetical protein